MGYEIKKLSTLNKTQINKAITIFIEGFYSVFSKLITRDKMELHKLLKDSLDFNMIYICLENNDVIGFLGIANSNNRPIKVKKETCKKLLGKIRGIITYNQLEPILHNLPVLNNKEVFIDYITTDIKFRRQGVATALINHICNNLIYDSYKLEVLSKNTEAIKLYESLGFKKINTSRNIITIFLGLGKIVKMQLILENKGESHV